MRNPAVIELVERRLVQLGCPAAQLRSRVLELGEHHDDLKQAALEEGLSEPDAEARADELLGEPVTLAGQISAVLRQSSWFGRHPFITFCLLPSLALILMAILGLSLDALAGRLYFTAEELSALADDGGGLALLGIVVLGMWCAMILLTAVFFCWLARRAACGLKWALMACVVCSFYSCCLGFQLHPHEFTFYCGFPPALLSRNWIPLITPLLVAAAVWWRHRQKLREIPALVLTARVLPGSRPQPVLPRARWVTPSSVIAAVAVAAIVVGGFWGRSVVARNAARDSERIEKIWPAERAVVMQQLKTRQTTSLAPEAATINLKPWLNAALADSLGGHADTNRNNLSELPRGIHVFDGIPFDVEGRLQLMGRKWPDLTTVFPVRARNIEIGRKCSRLHLLHGASGITPDLAGNGIARLVLHYADGSSERISIAAGAQVLDWWGPIYQTGADQDVCQLSSPGSQLAWAGANPCIKQKEPELSLRLYQSTFDNPRPDLEITTIDYVSTVTDAAPFLVGLTLE
jgi:hypothetical protein